MNWKHLFATAICALTFVACGNKTTTHSEDHHANEESGIALNDNQKWEVNEDMLPHIQAMEQAVQDFTPGDIAAYNELGAVLKGHNKNLIGSCTMKGDAHNELHKWLHPHMELIEEIGTMEDAEKGGGLLKDLEASFQSFHTYFE